MDLPTFRALLTEPGRQALAAAGALPDLSPVTELAHLTRLRRQFSPHLATAAVETELLRRRAAAKFSRSAGLFFTRDALEQATAEPVARYRAQRFARFGTVADLGCGIGGDTLALAAAGSAVIAVDRDPLRLAMVRANAEVYQVEGRVQPVLADVTALPLRTDAAFIDPARRTAGGQRVFSVEDYQPSLSSLLADPPAPAFAIKLSPAIRAGELSQLPAAGEVEFVSLNGDLRECVLWLGPLATTGRRATVLTTAADAPCGSAAVSSILGGDPPPTPVQPPGAFLLEPDAAVYRAGLLAELAAMLNAWQIDGELALLSVAAPVRSPFVRCHRIDAVLPFSLKRLKSQLRTMDTGTVTVKTRGSPLDANETARLLSGSGATARTVYLTQILGKPSAIITGP